MTHSQARPSSRRAHELIAENLFAAIQLAMPGSTCAVYEINTRVKITSTGLYTNSDVVVVCGETVVELEGSAHDAVLNPSVIIEVLDDETEAYDRGEKFARYRTVESLREYILVSQDWPCIEQYVRRDGYWDFGEVSGLPASLTIKTLDFIISLVDVYDRVEFPSPYDVKGAFLPVMPPVWLARRE
jgi:Uma2 family endonuclease